MKKGIEELYKKEWQVQNWRCLGKNTMNITNQFTTQVLKGNFLEAKRLACQFSEDELFNSLMEIAFENYNILSYVFVTYLISENEKAKYHSVASDILGSPLCHFTGAYQGALFHAKRALELDPYNLSYKEWILFFYEIPDRLVSREEAERIAREILREDPSNRAAQKIFE